jgi:hypothetical protein
MIPGLHAEPAVVTGVLRLVIYAAVSFGLAWSPEQVMAVLAASEGVLTLVTRATVTSTRTIEAAGMTSEEIAYLARKARDAQDARAAVADRH